MPPSGGASARPTPVRPDRQPLRAGPSVRSPATSCPSRRSRLPAPSAESGSADNLPPDVLCWASMRFGYWLMPCHGPRTNLTLAYEGDLRLAERAEDLGFEEFWVGEHHAGGWEL